MKKLIKLLQHPPPSLIFMSQEQILSILTEKEGREYLACYHFCEFDLYDDNKSNKPTSERISQLSESLSREKRMGELKDLAYQRMVKR